MLLLELTPIRLHRGEAPRVRQLLTELADMAGSESADNAVAYEIVDAVTLAAEGRRDDALAALDRALRPRANVSGNQTMLRFMAYEVVAGFDEPEKIGELLEIDAELHAGELPPFLRAQHARFRARLPEHDAEAERAEAERLFAEGEMPFYAAATAFERAAWLVGEGRVEEARPVLAAARETFERLRATPWLERVDAVATWTVPSQQQVAAPLR